MRTLALVLLACWGITCTDEVWVLEYEGEPLEWSDMTWEECEAARKQLDAMAPPFTSIECVRKGIARQDS